MNTETEPAPPSGLQLRARSAVVFSAILIAAALLGREATFIVFFVAGLLSVKEIIPLITRGKARAIWQHYFVFAVAFPVLLPLDFFGLTADPILQVWQWALAAGFIFFAFPAFKGPLRLHQSLGLLYILHGYAMFALLPILLAGIISESNPGPPLIDWQVYISFYLLQWSGDTFAYLIGRKWGRHPLAPRISPKKTIEGTLGGSFFVVLIALVISIWWRWLPVPVAVCMGVSVMVFGVLGDLLESAMKRAAGIKDSGNIMPGHGGLLDRFDSVLLSAPGTFYLVYIYYLATTIG